LTFPSTGPARVPGEKAQGGRADRTPATAFGQTPTPHRSKASKREDDRRLPAKRRSGNVAAGSRRSWKLGTVRGNSPRETAEVLMRGNVLWGVERREDHDPYDPQNVVRDRVKQGEPQGRQQASSLHPMCGANRRGGEKPRGRNETGETVSLRHGRFRERPSGVDAHGSRRRGGRRSCPS
jgi:hypothetical protein